MRVLKAFAVGYELRVFYNAVADAESATVLTTLKKMENHLSILSHGRMLSRSINDPVNEMIHSTDRNSIDMETDSIDMKTDATGMETDEKKEKTE